MNIIEKNIGTITLSGKIVISDPCYDRDTWCMITDFPVKPGKYDVQVAYSDEGDFGVRIAALLLIHTESKNIKSNEWSSVECVGVDSGQCGIFDDAIYPHKKDHQDFEPFYDECCKLTLRDEQCGILNNGSGVVTSSGYGDGSYEFLAVIRDGENVALILNYDLMEMNKIMRKLLQNQQ